MCTRMPSGGVAQHMVQIECDYPCRAPRHRGAPPAVLWLRLQPRAGGPVQVAGWVAVWQGQGWLGRAGMCEAGAANQQAGYCCPVPWLLLHSSRTDRSLQPAFNAVPLLRRYCPTLQAAQRDGRSSGLACTWCMAPVALASCTRQAGCMRRFYVCERLAHPVALT